jgi:hypothetical protein
VVAVVHLLAPLELAELQDHLRAHVAGYKVPRDLVGGAHVVGSPAGPAADRRAKQAAVEALGA